jgi:hypothetical protein
MSWYGDAISAWYRNQTNASDILAQGIQSLGQSIGHGIEEARQNSIANQIGTQSGYGDSQAANSGAYAPRAGLISPGDVPGTDASNYIPSGVPTAGTAPAPAKFTGGYKGLELKMAIDALRNRTANTQSEMDLRRAQGEYYGAHTNAIQENADTAAAREAAYEQSLRDKANQKDADSIQKLNSELTTTYGKNTAPHILGALQQDPTGAQHRGDIQTVDGQEVWVPNPNGKTFIPDAPQPTPEDKGGIFGLGAHPAQPKPLSGTEIKIPWEKAQQYQKRYDSVTSGNQPAAAGGGNLRQVTNAQDYAQVPSGSQYQDPQGNIRTKP